MDYIIDVIATFGAVFAYYDSPLFEKIRSFLKFTKLQVFLLFALFFTFTTVISFSFIDYLFAASSAVLFVNAFVTRLRQIRR